MGELRKRPYLLALVVIVVALLSIGGTGAVVCKLAVDCHLRGAGKFDVQKQLNDLARQDAGQPATLPSGYTEQPIARGLTFPTDFAFLPDGSALIAQKNGLVLIARDGKTRTKPFVDLRTRVNTQFYRGLMAIAVDPEYRSNHSIYVLYTQRQVGPPKGPTTMRLARLTVRGDSAPLSTLTVLLGAGGTSPCNKLSPGSDCLASYGDVDGGTIAFAADGSMFVSTGDGGGFDTQIEPGALNSQSLDGLEGKVLRVTRDGKGLPSNPFWNGDADANRSKVWAYGFRNPFRMSLRPGSLVAYLGDVGSHSHEEIDAAQRGGNYGWPCYEGDSKVKVYMRTPLCKTLYARGPDAVRWPAYTYPHKGSVAVTGGDFYTGPSRPGLARGTYVFGDWVRSWMKTLDFNSQGVVQGEPKPFASNLSGPVAIKAGPDGHLYYLSLNAGVLRRID